jgi:hypothetical protein
MLSHIARLLRPGGVLRLRDLIFDFTPSEADGVLDRWLDGAVGDPTQGYTREDLVEHLRTEHSTCVPNTAPSGGFSNRCSVPLV